MAVDAASLKAAIEQELAALEDPETVAAIRRMLVDPHVVTRDWDYEPGITYPCWMVLDDRAETGGEIAYCEFGFGPEYPWGLVSSDENNRRMGMDSGWYPRFLDAFFESFASTKLPIWGAFKENEDRSMTPLNRFGSWEGTWDLVMALRANDPQGRYHCFSNYEFDPYGIQATTHPTSGSRQ